MTERSIKNIYRGLEPAEYEAYVYEYTVKPSDKKYIGYHTGDVDDLYHHSSTHIEFKEIFENPKSEIYLKILDYGTTVEMKNLEYRELTKVDAANNPMYFNKTNGAPAYNHPDVDKISAIHEDIIRARFPKFVGDVEELHEFLIVEKRRVQARFIEDKEMVDWVAEQVQFSGNTNGCEELRILGDSNNKIEKLLDCNTTLLGSFKAKKHVSKIEYILIPKELATDDEWEAIALLLNPLQEKRKKPSSVKDIAKRLFRRFRKHGTPIRCKENKNFLDKMKVKNKSKVIKQAEKWVKNGKIIETYINYTHKHNKIKVQEKVESYPNDVEVIPFTTGKLPWKKFISWVFENNNYGKRKPKIKKLAGLGYHPDDVVEDQWLDDVGDHHRTMKYLCRQNNIDWLGFDYMPTQEDMS